jgi:hypothetical protein
MFAPLALFSTGLPGENHRSLANYITKPVFQCYLGDRYEVELRASFLHRLATNAI